MRPTFSVIIPTYNSVPFLIDCLESLKKQTFKDYEAFIIDDGSTDDTPKICEMFSSQRNWKFFRHNENKGQFYCRNLGMMESNGEYITFLDSDDVWFPIRLEKFAEVIRKNPNAGFIFSNGYIYQDGCITGFIFDPKRKIPRGKLPPYMAISDLWLPYVTTNVCFKREAIKKIGYFREDMKILEDMEYYTKILTYYEVDYIPQPLSIYRIHRSSLTQRWKDCLEDFKITLKSCKPPTEIENKLKRYVFLHHAHIFVRHSQKKDGLSYLRLSPKKKIDVSVLSFFTFFIIPIPILKGLQCLFHIIRPFLLKTIGPPTYKNIARKYLKHPS